MLQIAIGDTLIEVAPKCLQFNKKAANKDEKDELLQLELGDCLSSKKQQQQQTTDKMQDDGALIDAANSSDNEEEEDEDVALQNMDESSGKEQQEKETEKKNPEPEKTTAVYNVDGYPEYVIKFVLESSLHKKQPKEEDRRKDFLRRLANEKQATEAAAEVKLGPKLFHVGLIQVNKQKQEENNGRWLGWLLMERIRLDQAFKEKGLSASFVSLAFLATEAFNQKLADFLQRLHAFHSTRHWVYGAIQSNRILVERGTTRLVLYNYEDAWPLNSPLSAPKRQKRQLVMVTDATKKSVFKIRQPLIQKRRDIIKNTAMGLAETSKHWKWLLDNNVLLPTYTVRGDIHHDWSRVFQIFFF